MNDTLIQSFLSVASEGSFCMKNLELPAKKMNEKRQF